MRHALAIVVIAAAGAAGVTLLRADDVGERATQGPPPPSMPRATFANAAGPRPLDAAAVLRQAARVARAQPAPPSLTGGTFWYARADHTQLRIAGGNGTGFRHVVRERRENWIDASGYGRTRGTQIGEWEFPTEADRREAGRARGPGPGEVVWDARTRPPTPAATFRVGPRERSLRGVRRLPAHPGPLLAELRRSPRQYDSEILFQVADLLAVAPLPPKLRAALFEAISLLPGLTAGSAGRAVAVRLIGRQTETHLALDPRNARIEVLSLALRRARQGTRFRAGDVTNTIVYRAAGPVRSLDATR